MVLTRAQAKKLRDESPIPGYLVGYSEGFRESVRMIVKGDPKYTKQVSLNGMTFALSTKFQVTSIEPFARDKNVQYMRAESLFGDKIDNGLNHMIKPVMFFITED